MYWNGRLSYIHQVNSNITMFLNYMTLGFMLSAES